jgi:hypothetical protein
MVGIGAIFIDSLCIVSLCPAFDEPGGWINEPLPSILATLKARLPKRARPS